MAQELTSFLIRSFSHYRPAERPKRLESIQKTLGLQCTEVVFAMDKDSQIYPGIKQTSPLPLDPALLQKGKITDMRFTPGERRANLSLTVVSHKSVRSADADAQGPFYNDGWVIEGTRINKSKLDYDWSAHVRPDRELLLDPDLAPNKRKESTKHELLVKNSEVEVWLSDAKIYIYEQTPDSNGAKREIYNQQVMMFRRHMHQFYDYVNEVLYLPVSWTSKFKNALAAINISKEVTGLSTTNSMDQPPIADKPTNTAKHRVRYLHPIQNGSAFTIDLKRRRGYSIACKNEAKNLYELYEFSLPDVKHTLFGPQYLEDTSVDFNDILTGSHLRKFTLRSISSEGSPFYGGHEIHSAGPYLVRTQMPGGCYEDYNSGNFVTDPTWVTIMCKTGLNEVLAAELQVRSFLDPQFSEGAENPVIQTLYTRAVNIDIIGLVFAFHRVTFILFDRRKIKKQPTAFVTKHITLGISYIDRCLPDISARSLSFESSTKMKYLVLRTVRIDTGGPSLRDYDTVVEEEIDPLPYDEVAGDFNRPAPAKLLLLEEFKIKY